MNILGYLKAVHAQRQINKLARKYKNKKIVIYGAGAVSYTHLTLPTIA